MNEKLQTYKNKLTDTWSNFPKKTKVLILGSFITTLLLLILFVFLGSRTNYAVLYSDLSPQEAGEIKTAIEERGIPVELSPDGKTVSVPNDEVANLKVALAAEGIPQSGNVNYSIFSENMGLGMTDRHFDVVERDAMQNELAYLIEQIAGVQKANVMITLPKESVWLTDEQQFASASVVIQGDPTFQLDQKQVNGLYHLISKSIPNLPEDQIVIMDQKGQVFGIQDENAIDTALTTYQQQREIQKDIEQDIQRELQQMLGILLGQDKVVVSVMASIDFTKEKREENLVEPADPETNQGLEISVERIIESYTNNGQVTEEATGAGEGEIANYPSEEGASTSQSERTEERINREVNRIYRQIEMSPYVINDLTINVGVEPPEAGNPASLTQQNIEDISNLLKNTVSTTLSMNGTDLNDDALDDRISVFAAEFQGKPATGAGDPEEQAASAFPYNLLMMAGAALALILIIINLVIMLRRRNKRKTEKEIEIGTEMLNQPIRNYFEQDTTEKMEKESEIDLSEFDARANPKRKTIEKLAKERPDEFAKLLRSWMAQD